MLELFAGVDVSQDGAQYIARGLRALADCDGLHNNELALVEEFERGLGLSPTDGRDFEAAGGGPLASTRERELFYSSLQLLALADGRVSSREQDWLDSVGAELGIGSERVEVLVVEAKKYLLGSLAGVQAFRAQAVGVGRALGLSEADIDAVLG